MRAEDAGAGSIGNLKLPNSVGELVGRLLRGRRFGRSSCRFATSLGRRRRLLLCGFLLACVRDHLQYLISE